MADSSTRGSVSAPPRVLHCLELHCLEMEQTLALSMAAVTLVAAVLEVAGADDRVAVLARSAIPAMLLLAAIHAPRRVALGVLVAVLCLLACSAAGRPDDRAVLLATAVADLLIVGAQLTANHALRPRGATAVVAGPRHSAWSGLRMSAATAPHPHVPHLDRAPQPISRPAGWDRLSARQEEVLDLLLAGLTSQAVATRLAISKRTVETHASAGYSRLGVAGRVDLRLACLEIDETSVGRVHLAP